MSIGTTSTHSSIPAPIPAQLAGSAGPPSETAAPADPAPGWSAVYDELRRLARRHVRRDADTLQPTALVHEAYLRLACDPRVVERGRSYFFAAAARAMRQILVDHARRRSRLKRGGDEGPLTLETGDGEVDAVALDLLDLHRALGVLERLEPRQARVVECRYLAGLEVEETAAALGISPRTVKRDWRLARAWLFRELRGRSSHQASPPREESTVRGQPRAAG
ncbi:MAG: ECF-type sigma factor [Holophagales bacterium]|nr:ECF-type sigma factor [Holophagales bacterium]